MYLGKAEYICTVLYLGCKNIEITGAISPADEFTSVIGGYSRVFGDPHHRGGNTVTVEILATDLTLLFTISLTYEAGKEG